jgi:hypothetical protein
VKISIGKWRFEGQKWRFEGQKWRFQSESEDLHLIFPLYFVDLCFFLSFSHFIL